MARTVKILLTLTVFLVFINNVKAAEVIKAEPIFTTTAPVVKPHIVEPPSKPIQTLSPDINYVPKVNQNTNVPVVKNATLNVTTAPKTQNSTNTTVQPQMPPKPVVNPQVNVQQVVKPAINLQSKSGYVLFSVVKKQFLLSVASVDKKNAILKNTPANNNYYFPEGIVSNIFKYIDLNTAVEITKI